MYSIKYDAHETPATWPSMYKELCGEINSYYTNMQQK